MPARTHNTIIIISGVLLMCVNIACCLKYLYLSLVLTSPRTNNYIIVIMTTLPEPDFILLIMRLNE